MIKQFTIEQRDIKDSDGLCLPNVYIWINNEDIELRQGRDIVIVTKEKLQQLFNIIKQEL